MLNKNAFLTTVLLFLDPHDIGSVTWEKKPDS